MAYPGNNVHLTPSYNIQDHARCRDLCAEDTQCHYWTFDSDNQWCYLKSEKGSKILKDNRYTSGIDNPLCQSVEDNEIVNVVTESHITKSVTTSASVESDDRSETLAVRPVTPILSIYHDTGYRTVLTALPATFGLTIDNQTEVNIDILIDSF